MSTTVSEALIRDVVSEVLSRLQGNGRVATAPPVPAGGRDGIFQTVDEAVAAAKVAQKRLVAETLETRAKAIKCIRRICLEQKEELARIEYDETRIGRMDHKIEKLIVVGEKVPGMEMLTSEAVSGDHGLTVTEHAPWGVLGVITPVTHSIPTLGCNAIMMIAAGNTLVCNPHPSGARCAAVATQRWNRAIREATGLDNLICLIEKPTLQTADQIFKHPDIAMLVVTGGPGVVAAAMASNKKAIVAGPGNPPVVVDCTADIEKAAAGIIFGHAYDNNLLCIGEKEVIVVEAVADKLLEAFSRHGGYRLNAEQIRAFTAMALHKDEKSGHWLPDKKFVGKDPQVLADAIGIRLPQGTQCLYGEVDEHSPWLPCEQMMPFLPVVRAKSIDQAIAMAVEYEHGFGHTAIIWSRNVENMTKMGKAVDTTIFVKNGACMASLGAGGEGFASFSIATPTGEGITSPMTFTRYRRCVMVDNLRIL
ncbi:MAG TPA: aldehyde dehydrogenase EutE [Phycisphaerae bacterium]|nr:aldehyde dehydrogenase EutE [Phycisphaerae bacterium]HRR83439.1 aldehyde dehydrogenase EutE [Phycisphaerae bacterium]